MRLRQLFLALIALIAMPALFHGQESKDSVNENPLDIPYRNADGTTETLRSAYPGKALLLVNTASECGYTPQYKDLEALSQQFKEKGVVVIAFPSNDFGGQEPGTDAEIQEFCTANFGVQFPVKAKMPTAGDKKSPLYAALTGAASPFPGEVKWNFEKFVLAPDGEIVGRFRSAVKPQSAEIVAALEKALAKK